MCLHLQPFLGKRNLGLSSHLFSTKTSTGKWFCSVVCKQLLWEAAGGSSFAREEQSSNAYRSDLRCHRYVGGCGGAGGVPLLGPAAEADTRRRDGRRRAEGGVKGRTRLALRRAARLFLVLHAHRVCSRFQAVLFARFVWFALLPVFANVTRTRSWWESSLHVRMFGGGI